MKNLIALAVVLVAPIMVLAQDDAPKAPATASAPAATTSAPTSKPVALATVGDVKIMSDRIDKIIAQQSAGQEIPPEMLGRFRSMLVERAVMMELMTKFLTTQKVEVTDDELKTQKDQLAKAATAKKMTVEEYMAANDITVDMLRNEAKLRKIMTDGTSKEKVEQFIKANPNYFNGTKIKASHILVMVRPTASTEELKAAKAKLEAALAEIKAGKIKFEDAAKKVSDCPSKEKGGDLGEWTYVGDDTAKMDKTFSKAAFATKVGEISPIVHTQFGFHAIKVTGLTEGKEKPGEEAEAAAKQALEAEIFAQIMELPLTGTDVVISK